MVKRMGVPRLVKQAEVDLRRPRRGWPALLLVLAWAGLLAGPQASSAQVGTAFSYQGLLEEEGVPASGSYDFRFSLYPQPMAGPQLAMVPAENTAVSDGLFQVEIDFGPVAWEQEPLWLEIEVRPDGGGLFTALGERQRLLPTPVALRAVSVGEDSVGALEVIESEVQQRVTGTCAAGSSIRVIQENGKVVCEADDGGGWNESGATVWTGKAVGINESIPEATLHVRDQGATLPAILVEGASVSEGDLAWRAGEVLQLGTWNGATGVFDRKVSIDGEGKVYFDNAAMFDNVLGDKLSLFGDRFGQANMYGFGVGDGMLYYKSNGVHAWYVGDADVTTEAPSMYLTQSSLGIGTTVVDGYRLSVNGTVRAKEIVVEAGWADYVFEDDYRLRPLEEVASFIAQNGHLPDVPSAAEVEEKGVALGEMESTLLRKVEELTLYVLELHREIESLRRSADDGGAR